MHTRSPRTPTLGRLAPIDRLRRALCAYLPGSSPAGTGLCAADDLSFGVVPVQQHPYDPAWPTQYEAARSELVPIFGADAMIEHIGSTSIPGCSAQPIIDILVQLPVPLNFDQRDGLEALNYGNQLGDDAAEVFFRPERQPRCT